MWIMCSIYGGVEYDNYKQFVLCPDNMSQSIDNYNILLSVSSKTSWQEFRHLVQFRLEILFITETEKYDKWHNMEYSNII